MIRRRALYYFVLLTVVALLILKCGHPNSSADFYINNQSDFSLFISIKNKPLGAPLISPDYPIPNKTMVKIFEQGAIGENSSITPSEALEWIYLYIQINDSADHKLVYQENPVIDEKWDLIEHLSGKGGTRNVWELLIENSDLDINLYVK